MQLIELPGTLKENVGPVQVIGYDLNSESPVIDFGAGPTTVKSAMRKPWDVGEDDDLLTPDQLSKIDDLVEHLKPCAVDGAAKSVKHLPGEHDQQSHGRGG